MVLKRKYIFGYDNILLQNILKGKFGFLKCCEMCSTIYILSKKVTKKFAKKTFQNLKRKYIWGKF